MRLATTRTKRIMQRKKRGRSDVRSVFSPEEGLSKYYLDILVTVCCSSIVWLPNALLNIIDSIKILTCVCVRDGSGMFVGQD